VIDLVFVFLGSRELGFIYQIIHDKLYIIRRFSQSCLMLLLGSASSWQNRHSLQFLSMFEEIGGSYYGSRSVKEVYIFAGLNVSVGEPYFIANAGGLTNNNVNSGPEYLLMEAPDTYSCRICKTKYSTLRDLETHELWCGESQNQTSIVPEVRPGGSDSCKTSGTFVFWAPVIFYRCLFSVFHSFVRYYRSS